MKITYITHACLLIEIQDMRILTDPWLVGSCWAGAHWHYPPPKELLNHSQILISYIFLMHMKIIFKWSQSIDYIPK